MKRYLVIVLALMMVAGHAFAAGERMISVSGNGQVSADPDIAYVNFGVSVIAPTAQKSQAGAAELMTKVVDTLSSLGFGKDKIETSSFSINPEMSYASGKAPKITGYRCDNHIKVTIENLGVIGGLIDAGILAGANNVSSVMYDLKDDIKAKTSALEKAVQDARNKADAIAKSAGVGIKNVFSIIESGANVVQPEYARSMMAANAETPIVAGKVKVNANVTVNFEI